MTQETQLLDRARKHLQRELDRYGMLDSSNNLISDLLSALEQAREILRECWDEILIQDGAIQECSVGNWSDKRKDPLMQRIAALLAQQGESK